MSISGVPRSVVFLQIFGVMERRDVTVRNLKAGHFKADDIGGKMQGLVGNASLSQHSLSIEQPLGTACLVR